MNLRTFSKVLQLTVFAEFFVVAEDQVHKIKHWPVNHSKPLNAVIAMFQRLGLSVPLNGTQELFTRFGTGTRLELSSTWGRAAQTKRL